MLAAVHESQPILGGLGLENVCDVVIGAETGSRIITRLFVWHSRCESSVRR